MEIKRHFVLIALLVLVSCRSDDPATLPAPPPVQTVTAQDLAAQLARDAPPLVLDVRTPAEFEQGHVPGARNMPYTDVPRHLEELAPYKDHTIVMYCQSGHRAGIAARTLQEAGFKKLAHLAGDMPGWFAKGLPVEQ